MPFISFSRAAVPVAGCVLGIGALLAGTSSASTGRATASSPPKTVKAARVTGTPGTLKPGSKLRGATIFSQRVFTDAKHGFAIASPVDADYPVATVDGGKTWRTNGPALHLHAAQAPLAVVNVTVFSRKTIFDWGGGQVIDATSNGGKTWYRALFQGGPLAVEPGFNGHPIAFIGSFDGKSVWEYTTRDGGRTWHYLTKVVLAPDSAGAAPARQAPDSRRALRRS